MKNVDNLFVAIEFNDGQRFELDLAPSLLADQQINLGIKTFLATESAPLGALVEVVSGTDHSALNPTAGVVAVGDQFNVTIAHNEVAAASSVKTVRPIAFLSPA